MKKKLVKKLDVADIQNLQSEIIYFKRQNDGIGWDEVEVRIYSNGSHEVSHSKKGEIE
jgi:hypothetical protein